MRRAHECYGGPSPDSSFDDFKGATEYGIGASKVREETEDVPGACIGDGANGGERNIFDSIISRGIGGKGDLVV